MTSASFEKSGSIYSAQPSWTDRMCKRFVISALNRFSEGYLVIQDGETKYSFGDDNAEITATIQVHEPAAYRSFILAGSTGAGEAFMKGYWSSPNLLNVVRIFCQNLNKLNQIDHSRPLINRITAWMLNLRNINSLKGSRKNISAHYDLGNEFFSLFLDPTMMYSSAIYDSDANTLTQAAVNKLDTVCRKLKLNQQDHLLEIGTGWGGLAIHAATHFGCKVTTTTISRKQYEFATEAVKKAGLSDKVTVLLKDYRELDGKFDKLVSIEMIEAVGYEYYRQYFATCSNLLKEQGLMCLQAITIADQRFEEARTSEDFIKRYIFPGGCLPSISIIADRVAKYTDLQMVHLQDIGRDYARTLADWRQAFLTHLAAIKQLGYSESFCRMWEYYLCYCEGGFIERAISTSQIVLAKPLAHVDHFSAK